TAGAKAVIVPHMFGNPADLERIEEPGIPLVEDCAHSVGALYGNRRTGSMGRFSILSFYANKMLACGEGGAILSDDGDILDFARDRRDYDEKADYKVRYNCKMTDIQAALGLVQLKRLPDMIRRRKMIAARYDEAFADMHLCPPAGEFDHVYYRYVLRTGKDPAGIIACMREKGIMCSKPVFKPLHRYLEMRSGFRNTDEAYSNALSIPVYPSLTEEERERVIKAVRECMGA
ncbi:MAG: DegT/DnrJ/EryC1/StrS family aminotransferase, partial [Candidatus Omnitrophica bacterium]|nr:DegT/DnrJ/EryC1/StrS family aminotransferase [Candidatus Omnitrophota bacterium]